MEILVGDTLYFDADHVASGRGLWAYDTSNASTWQVANYQRPGEYMGMLVGDTLYFSVNDGGDRELWAHDTSNASTLAGG
jgi:ELWxxDGT repeat protein